MLVMGVGRHPGSAPPRYGTQPVAEWLAMPPHQKHMFRVVPTTSAAAIADPTGTNGFTLY